MILSDDCRVMDSDKLDASLSADSASGIGVLCLFRRTDHATTIYPDGSRHAPSPLNLPPSFSSPHLVPFSLQVRRAKQATQEKSLGRTDSGHVGGAAADLGFITLAETKRKILENAALLEEEGLCNKCVVADQPSSVQSLFLESQVTSLARRYSSFSFPFFPPSVTFLFFAYLPPVAPHSPGPTGTRTCSTPWRRTSATSASIAASAAPSSPS